jgi:hypothetical protein
MHAIDGCDLQKHNKTAGLCDERKFNSRFFLSCGFVDGFKDEVKSHAARGLRSIPHMLWNLRTAFWFQRVSRITAVVAIGR